MDEYPGLGLPLRREYERKTPSYPIGAHGSCRASISEPLYVREVAMMSIMEKLTDKEDWHKKVFDDEIVSKWRKEAFAIPDSELWRLATSEKSQIWVFWDDEEELRETDSISVKPLTGIMSEATFDCCIKELRSKARYFEQTGIIPTLDACASVAKSDKLVSRTLHNALRNAFDKLISDQKASPDWHPNSNDMVQDLVHPSLFPLVYGRSRGFKKQCVDLENAVSAWAGKGDIIPKDTSERVNSRDRPGVGSSCMPPEYWSDTYQWLPANVAFQEDGSVKFTSYINNLHPAKYAGIYRVIEDLIQTSLPLWDQCLIMEPSNGTMEGAGRTEARFGLPLDPDDNNPENWIPNNMDACKDMEVDEETLADKGWNSGEFDYAEAAMDKWIAIRKPRIPEPVFQDVQYMPEEGTRLVDRFRDSGLQIIVKMASIELTPEKHEFPSGGWHVEGQMNEYICATALYYLDSENITDSSLAFRMQTDPYLNDEDDYPVSQDAYEWMEQVYGTILGGNMSFCLQNYGSVSTPQGRLLAFPNVFQHRVSNFSLIDPTKPGHRRFIALWLVDPNRRIISTANIPPQQMTWYIDSLLGSTASARDEALSKLPAELVILLAQNGFDNTTPTGNAKLPAELMDMVSNYFHEDKEPLPMSLDEAREHRARLMEERSAIQTVSVSDWQSHTYNFCEH